MAKGCGCCSNSNVSRRDFLANGDVREVAPHKKKKGKKPGAAKKVDHKHLWETNGWEKQFRSKWSSEHGYFVRDTTRWYLIRRWECLECGKPGKIEYDWKRDPKTGYYYY